MTLTMTVRPYNSEEILKAMGRADYEFVLKNAMPHALSGNPDAQCTIGLLYEVGWGVKRDLLEAERWLLRATAQNSALAWHNLGTLYATKYPDLKQRWGEAQECWERAKELGFDCDAPNSLRGLGKGTRFEVLEDIETNGLVHWAAPVTSGFHCVIPKGTILKTFHDYPSVPVGVSLIPEDYKEFEEKHVPAEDRNEYKYAGYSFVFIRPVLEAKLRRM